MVYSLECPFKTCFSDLEKFDRFFSGINPKMTAKHCKIQSSKDRRHSIHSGSKVYTKEGYENENNIDAKLEVSTAVG